MLLFKVLLFVFTTIFFISFICSFTISSIRKSITNYIYIFINSLTYSFIIYNSNICSTMNSTVSILTNLQMANLIKVLDNFYQVLLLYYIK